MPTSISLRTGEGVHDDKSDVRPEKPPQHRLHLRLESLSPYIFSAIFVSIFLQVQHTSSIVQSVYHHHRTADLDKTACTTETILSGQSYS